MGLLHWPREGAHEWEVVVGAVILSRLIGPECLHGLNGLPRLRPAVGEIASHNLRLFFIPASADTKEKPALGEVVQRRDLLRQQERIALRDQRNAGAELERRRHCRGPGQGYEGIHESAIEIRDATPRGTRSRRGAMHGYDRVFP